MSDIKFWESKNLNVIRRILKDKDILENMLEDSDNFNIYDLNVKKLNRSDLVIIQVREGPSLGGVLFCTKEGKGVAKVDIALLPHFKGKKALMCIDDIAAYMHKNHDICIFYGKINKANKKSLIFAKWAKFSIVNDDDENYWKVVRYE